MNRRKINHTAAHRHERAAKTPGDAPAFAAPRRACTSLTVNPTMWTWRMPAGLLPCAAPRSSSGLAGGNAASTGEEKPKDPDESAAGGSGGQHGTAEDAAAEANRSSKMKW